MRVPTVTARSKLKKVAYQWKEDAALFVQFWCLSQQRLLPHYNMRLLVPQREWHGQSGHKNPELLFLSRSLEEMDVPSGKRVDVQFSLPLTNDWKRRIWSIPFQPKQNHTHRKWCSGWQSYVYYHLTIDLRWSRAVSPCSITIAQPLGWDYGNIQWTFAWKDTLRRIQIYLIVQRRDKMLVYRNYFFKKKVPPHSTLIASATILSTLWLET